MRGKSASAFRKPLIAAIEATGGTVWPKLFTALRATRDTEMRETYPGHVVDAWIGHDEKVAKHNYLQVTESHFEKAVQNPVQYPAATARTELQTKKATPEKHRELPLNAAQCEAVQNHQVGDTGLEPVTPCL